MDKGIQNSKFLPEVHFRSTVSVLIKASSDVVYQSLIINGFDQSQVLNLLFGMKGMKLPSHLHLDQQNGSKFTTLDVIPNESIAIGIIGKFWKMSPDFLEFQRADFSAPLTGQVKAVWLFLVKENIHNTTTLTLQTDVYCTDKSAHRHFNFYWKLEEPLSCFIRKWILQSIRNTIYSKSNRPTNS